MERYTMFLDWKNQYCDNDYTTQSIQLIHVDVRQGKNKILKAIIPQLKK